MQLREYQEDAVQFVAKRDGRALIALPPGAGKTAIVSSWLPDHNKLTLIICPNGPVVQHWRNEIERWHPGLPVAVGTGTAKRRATMREAVARCDSGVLVLNYEAMRIDIEELLEIPWHTVVFDESHRLKGRRITFKCAAKLAKAAENCVLVTGTPILNRADELWVSFHLLNPKDFKSYWRWVEYHFTIEYPRYGRRVIRKVGPPKPDHVKMLRDDLHGRMFYRPMKEILPELPEMSETTYVVDLSPAERKAYDSMLQDFWMEVGDEVVQAVNTVAQQTRLRQLASDWSVFGNPPGTKAQTAKLLVETLDQQVVVFCAFRDTAEAVASLLPDSATYHGGIPAEQRARRIEAFRAGEITTLVATIATMGEGVDGLQGCHNVIMLDRLWTPARNEQAIGRCLRLGQKDNVNVMHIVARESIDYTVAYALEAKESVIDAVVKERTRAVHPS
jgi:non-specific serine/threonine protein kinase